MADKFVETEGDFYNTSHIIKVTKIYKYDDNPKKIYYRYTVYYKGGYHQYKNKSQGMLQQIRSSLIEELTRKNDGS